MSADRSVVPVEGSVRQRGVRVVASSEITDHAAPVSPRVREAAAMNRTHVVKRTRLRVATRTGTSRISSATARRSIHHCCLMTRCFWRSTPSGQSASGRERNSPISNTP